MSKPSISTLLLFVLAILAGPILFYGLFSPENGMIELLADNFWLLAGTFIGFIIAWSLTILWFGHKKTANTAMKERENG